MPLFNFPSPNPNTFRKKPIPHICYGMYLRYYRHILAVYFAINEINENPNLLPNITLGYEIYDSCSYETKAVEGIFKLMSRKQDAIPSYQCSAKNVIAGVIGEFLSTSTYNMAQVTGIYRYPQISYGAQDPVLDDKSLFPSFFRMVPNDKTQYEAFVQLCLQFGWTWVGLVAVNDERSVQSCEEIKTELMKNGICVAYFEIISLTVLNGYQRAVDTIRQSTANVVIVYCSAVNFFSFIFTAQLSEISAKVFIIPTVLSAASDSISNSFFSVLNGSLLLSIHKGEIPGLKDFLYSVSPYTLPNDYFTAATWNSALRCLPVNATEFRKKFGPARNCTGKETLKIFDSSYDVNSFKITYAAYRAVYAFASALHDIFSSMQNKSVFMSYLKETFHPSMLNKYIRKVNFKTKSGEEFYFVNGSPAGQYDIMNWVIAPNQSIITTQVGSFLYTAPKGQQLFINKNKIMWNARFNQTPRSVCSESCPPGYWKATRKLEPICCYDCVSCSEGEISNSTDMEKCIMCAEDQWSNENRTMCISKTIDFLSYEDALGIALSVTAIFLSIVPLGLLGIFLKHSETAIVKANNRELSYILLLSLSLCSLCSLLFIGRPVALSCFFQQAAFGIIFAVAVSSILSKTITVVIAFSATKPGSRARKWVGSRVSTYLVSLGTFGEALICLIWFLCSPPFPDFDTSEKSEKMTLKCNEGSEFAFYCVMGYVGLLAALSFVVAFLARKLPDSFNEATYITFSMLVFFSVWISFIPAYLSTKGKYTVAVEIFAILASTAGLVSCIFAPKCYIIVIRPDLNTKEHLIGKKVNRYIVEPA
ncbi:vomeronasal type-2 receptor 26 [Xenopus laevis]|nr:vomeronasal type-2 receptor 26 [Xenopus laevis]